MNFICPLYRNCTINCDGSDTFGSCSNSYIQCPQNGNCYVNCVNGSLTCSGTHIQCPEQGECIVQCDGSKSLSPCSALDVNIRTSNFKCYGSTCPEEYSESPTRCAFHLHRKNAYTDTSLYTELHQTYQTHLQLIKNISMYLMLN